jgi:EAL domain-containing protein (putative c-di-GMP-specific phosphodiesterase class I)
MLSVPIIKRSPIARADQTAPYAYTGHSVVASLDYDFAFQPIVNMLNKSIYGHEALVRGVHGSPAETVLNQVKQRHQFDQVCRVKAIKTAHAANIQGMLPINFMPNAVNNPARSLLTTLEACYSYNFPTKNIIFEFNEQELVEDAAHIVNIGREYKKLGFKTAIDDFGAGYAGLNFIANFQPDILKIDMHLIREIDKSQSKQAIIKAVVSMCEELNITIVAEGIETIAERNVLLDYGIHLFQGYLFCKPSFRSQGLVNELAWLS